MIDEQSIEKLTAKLKKIQSSIEDKVKIIQISTAKDSIFWAKMRKSLDKDFEESRVIFNDYMSTELGKEYMGVAKLQIAKIKQYGPGSASFSEFTKSQSNNQTLSAILNDANAAFFIGTAAGEKSLIRLMSVTQQINITEDLINKSIAEGFEEYGSKYGPVKRLKKELLEKAVDGKYVTVINKNGKPMYFKLEHYADLVARTKLMEASTAGVVNTATKYGADLVQVSAHNTETEYDAWFEGKIFSLSGNDPDFELAPDLPPFHPNCVLEGTSCIPAGKLVSCLRGIYKGPVRKFRFSNGRDITVTVNHMFLTPQGFVSADLLRNGDDIFYCSDFEGIGFRNPDIDRGNFLIKNIFISLAESYGVFTAAMPVSSEDIHGDGKFIQKNIDIVRADSFLNSTIYSKIFKHFKAKFFKSGIKHTLSFNSSRYFAAMFKRLAFAFDSSMGLFRKPDSFFLRRFGISDSGSLGQSSMGNMSKREVPPNSRPAYSGFSSYFGKRFSRIIKICNVVDIQQYSFHGPVYSLETDTSLYISNGILSSNCKHSISIVFREALASQGTLGKYIDFSNGTELTHPTRTSFVPITERGFNKKNA
jgi:hypothetical protein